MKKKALIFSAAFCLVAFAAKAQWVDGGTKITTTDWVGINTNFPSTRFHIQGGGFLLDYGPDDSPGLGNDVTNMSQYPGVKFYFNQVKQAFRGGKITGNQWINDNVAPYSFAFGYNVIASGQSSFAVGDGSVASGPNASALGESTASALFATAVGNATANGGYSFAAGESVANGGFSFAAGNSFVNNGDYGASFGTAMVDGDYGFAAGKDSYANGIASTALGSSQTAGDYTLSSGYNTIAQGDYSTALGYYTTAQGLKSITIGSGAHSMGKLVNSINNSLMVGFNSNRATLYVGPSAGVNTFGRVGIGTTAPQSELAVNGTITAKALNLTMVGWPDYVFDNNYKVRTLEETEQYINEHKHLPNVPSAKEVEENGLNVGEMNKIMMEKIEELTLYLIEIKKENQELRTQVNNLTKKN